METIAAILGLAAATVILLALPFIRFVTIFEYERGLLYRNGKFVSVLAPGRHPYLAPWFAYRKVDVRKLHITLPGQEMLTADTISVKISLAVSYQVVDPHAAINRVANFYEALYLIVQLELREVVGSLAVDDLLVKREEIGKAVLERSVQKAADLGLELSTVGVRDIMLPGELKNIFAQVVNARKAGLAALERARGESAALRNLANAARLLDGNPNLQQLRLLHVMENKTGNTVVLLGDALSIQQNGSRKGRSTDSE
jgi:regulator of protease activity HflC (stomatin/prohibitin superfamily)